MALVVYTRLAMVLIDTVAFPVKLAIKARTERNPEFRERVITFAQWYHRVNVNLQRNLYGHVTDVEIRPLNEERAVSTAADLVGELIVFTIGGIVVIFEVQRSARSEARKEEKARVERESLKLKDEELEREINILRERLDALEREHRSNSRWLPSLPGLGGGGSSSTSSSARSASARSGSATTSDNPSQEKQSADGPQEKQTGDGEDTLR